MSRPIAYLGDNLLLTTTRLGRKIYVDGRDLSLAPHLLMEGDWERWVSQAMQRALLAGAQLATPGALVLDVGANFGWYSLLAHFTAEGAYQVRAYEANYRLAGLLRRTFAVNGIPVEHVREVAVSDSSEGHVELTWEWRDMGSGSVALCGESEGSQRSVVPQLKLDDDVPPGTSVALIKVDVEGHEPAVVAGASRILAENPACLLFLEWHAGAETLLCLQSLQQRGYQLRHIQHDASLSSVLQPESLEGKLRDADMLYIYREAQA